MRKEDLDTPELLVDLKVLERNISKMQEFADSAGVHLRPMTKTHKIPGVAKMQVEAGSYGIQCAKLEEAEVMADAGIEDIFISNEIIGEKKIERLMGLAKKVTITIAIDSFYGAAAVSKIAERHGLKLATLIAIDVGNRRSGVLPGEPALQLAKKVKGLRGVDLKGIYTHEGNVYTAKNQKELKEKSLVAAEDMVNTAKLLESKGIPVEVVSVGSTPGVKYNATYPRITEVRPGAYIFNDISQIDYGFCGLEDCAVSIMVTIISKPVPTRVLCDAGSKEIFPPVEWMRFKNGAVLLDWARVEIGTIVGLNHRPLPGVALEKIHEEYGFITLAENAPELNIGEKIEIIPYHICPNLNLWDEITVIEDGEVKMSWPIVARGKFK